MITWLCTNTSFFIFVAKTELPTSIPPSALVPASASALSKHPRDEGEASRAPVRKKKSSGAQLIGFCYLPRDRSSCEDVSRFSKEELVDIYLHEELRGVRGVVREKNPKVKLRQYETFEFLYVHLASVNELAFPPYQLVAPKQRLRTQLRTLLRFRSSTCIN
ncbi:hypothetical protein CDL15_Pgr013931 [Punica granatum]|uniref:Uncharacterized protein n=1 Tax=Punica granatum TaxID=22663 RepID=A0A218WAV4_PUNGR|nr:hypothetical protein CDL15_Pgr013931 [Punica granatum]